MHHVLFLTVCCIWATSFILMKRASESFGAVSIGAWRVFGGALFLALIWAVKREGWSIKRKHYRHIIFISLIVYIWPFSIQPFMVARHGAAFVGMMVSLVPLMTVLMSIPMLKIHPSVRQLAGVLGGLACLLLLLKDGIHRSIPVSHMLMMMSVPTVYAFGNTYIKQHLSDVPALTLACVCLGLASLIMLPASQFALSGQVIEGGDIVMATKCLVILGLFCTGLATYIGYTLIQQRGPLFAGMVSYLVPPGAMMWGWWDKEQITATQVVCLCGVLLMVALVQTDRSAINSNHPGN